MGWTPYALLNWTQVLAAVQVRPKLKTSELAAYAFWVLPSGKLARNRGHQPLPEGVRMWLDELTDGAPGKVSTKYEHPSGVKLERYT